MNVSSVDSDATILVRQCHNSSVSCVGGEATVNVSASSGQGTLVLSEGQNTFGIRGSQGMSALTVNNGASDLLSIERTTGGASISGSLLIGNGSDAASMSLISKSQPTSMNVEGSLAHTTVVASSGQIARVDMKEGSAPGDAFSLSYNDTVATLSLRRGAIDHLMQARVRR